MMMRRAFAALLAVVTVVGAHAQDETPAPPALAPAVAKDLHDLATAVVVYLRTRGSDAPMPWGDALVLPDPQQLQLGKRTLRWSQNRLQYRAAFDPTTRWYYVVRFDSRGPVDYFGPIERNEQGDFVDWQAGER